MSGHVETKKNYFLVFGALLVLTALTVGVAFINFGFLNTPLALIIATIKALLVILIFMHVRYSGVLVRIFLGCGFIWLLVLFGLTMGDYGSRDWDAISKLSSWTPAAQTTTAQSTSKNHH